MKPRFLAGLALAVTLCSCGSNDSSPSGSAPAQSLCGGPAASTLPAVEAPAGRYLVKLKPGLRLESRAAGARARLQRLGATKMVAKDLLLVDAGGELDKAIVRDAAGSEVDYVEPDLVVHEALAADDPDLGKQWAHPVVQSEKAWDLSRGDPSVIVAVLDSGIDPNHEDLAANLWTNPGETANGADDDGNGYVDDIHGWNFVSDTNDVTADDAHFHGTHVSGTIGAVGNNGKGISGHAPVVRLMPLKFLDDTGSGFTSNAIRGIDYAIAKGARIISNSWGSFGYSQALDEAVGRAEAAGILFVAAAGNSGINNSRYPFYPANLRHENVISVASSTSADRLSSFSDYGTRVHLAAPGSAIYSTRNGNTYQTLSGTSMATPLVSGVLATMIALRPDLAFGQIKGALLSAVDPVPAMYEKLLWNGRVNAFRALTLVSGVPADWVPPAPPAHACL